MQDASCTARSSRKWTALWFATLTSLALMTLGCQSLTGPSEARAPIPPSLTAPCQPLQPLSDGLAATVLRWITETAESYRECSSKHKALIEATR